MSDMGSYYQCSDPDSNEKNWTGHIRPLNINRNEFEVTARGSTFHLLVGKHAYGKYLCIPNWGIGTEISSLSDCFWNRGRLEQDYSELSKVDVISIVKALIRIPFDLTVIAYNLRNQLSQLLNSQLLTGTGIDSLVT